MIHTSTDQTCAIPFESHKSNIDLTTKKPCHETNSLNSQRHIQNIQRHLPKRTKTKRK